MRTMNSPNPEKSLSGYIHLMVSSSLKRMGSGNTVIDSPPIMLKIFLLKLMVYGIPVNMCL